MLRFVDFERHMLVYTAIIYAKPRSVLYFKIHPGVQIENQTLHPFFVQVSAGFRDRVYVVG